MSRRWSLVCAVVLATVVFGSWTRGAQDPAARTYAYRDVLRGLVGKRYQHTRGDGVTAMHFDLDEPRRNERLDTRPTLEYVGLDFIRIATVSNRIRTETCIPIDRLILTIKRKL